jgi:hypothetical protein
VSPLFTLNFKREAYAREMARTRRRVVILGVWVTYFGVLALLLGLYSLNCMSLHRRVRQVERQTARLRGGSGGAAEWKLRPNDLAQVERYVANTRLWRDRFARLAEVMPPNAAVTSLALNPRNVSTPAEQNKLVITGTVKVVAGQDRMRSVMGIVTSLHRDSVFSRSYSTIRLASTRVSESPEPVAEFVIECK